MRGFGREDGVALVTGIILAAVVSLIAVSMLGLAAHNSEMSAYDRKRVQAIHAAEAGINNYFAAMKSSTGINSCSPRESTLPISPGAQYRVSVQLYSTWPPVAGSELPCPPPAGVDPVGAKFTSEGTAVSPGSGRAVTRAMQSEVRMDPVYPQYGAAIFSDRGVTLQNKMTVNGNLGNDGNVYTNGNFVMGNNTVISGSVFAQGTASINQGVVKADVWSNGAVDLHNLTVYGNVISSLGSVVLDNVEVYGSVKAAGSITLSNNSVVRGDRVTNSPSGPPPRLDFPKIAYYEKAWTDSGYVVQHYSDCAAARAAIVAGGVAGQNTLIRVNAVCQIAFGNNDLILVKGNLAIVTDGSFLTQNQVTFRASGGTHKLYVISPWRDGLPCPTPSPYDLTFSNQSRIEGLSLFAYTPCTVNFGNNNSSGAAGQIIGGVVNITNQMILNYSPVIVPSNPVGYTVKVAYLREVVPGS